VELFSGNELKIPASVGPDLRAGRFLLDNLVFDGRLGDPPLPHPTESHAPSQVPCTSRKAAGTVGSLTSPFFSDEDCAPDRGPRLPGIARNLQSKLSGFSLRVMTNRRTFFYRVSELLAILCWSLLYLLRNRRQGWLTREEIRLARLSFSQFGEDLAIEELIGKLGIERGFYVDVGAFDPVVFSNTLLLFRRGWSGINIDVEEEKIGRFRRFRPRDWNVVCGVSKVAGRKTFGRYADAPTTRMITSRDTHSVLGDEVIDTFEVQTKPLQSILDESPFRAKRIDFLNIDCEGADLEVLQSLDFAIHQPRVVAVEALDIAAERDICAFMRPKGYEMTHHLGLTRLFLLRS
jgi:FkbM family methyltransferase